MSLLTRQLAHAGAEGFSGEAARTAARACEARWAARRSAEASKLPWHLFLRRDSARSTALNAMSSKSLTTGKAHEEEEEEEKEEKEEEVSREPGASSRIASSFDRAQLVTRRTKASLNAHASA
ncbi:hypothetical protein TGRUB_432650 [Toxoplasma gondii RUB]|uniref:Uncharacterized protein n=1 Tax=Toxoplasma gondii RUB TaxID=935652 RepID=A0A086LQN0_TOXGO|nr:hypothetical protein TGRUB_432650 [Toxoplasma gondii RUB]